MLPMGTGRTNLLKILAFSFWLLGPSFYPQPIAAAQTPARPPKIGLALSGGGARGAAHIGVLKVLVQEGIPIDYIAGTSFGALVGAFYALGYSPAEIETIFAAQDWNKIFSDSPDRRLSPLVHRKNFRYLGEIRLRHFGIELPAGLWGGQKLTEMLNFYTTEGILAAGYDFDRLRTPFRAVATDLLTGKPYVFKSGPLTEALRASSAIPLMFTPVEKDDMLLVDGGLVNNLPTNLVRDMGADIVIAVDVSSPLLEKSQLKTLIAVMDQTISLQMRLNLEASLKFADLVVRPDLEGINYGSYRQVTEIVARGETAALSLKNDLEKLATGLARRAPPPRPRLPAPAVIESIAFDGLTHVDPSQLLKEIQNRSGEPVNLETIRGDQRRLYATRLFDQVDYRLTAVRDNRYRLTYTVREAALNAIGASIRFDSDYEFVGLAEFTARELFRTPSFVTLSSQFGGLENHFASLRLIHPKVPYLFLEPQIYLRTRERLDVREQKIADRFIDHRFGGQLMIGGTIARRLEASGGFHLERVTISGGTEPNVQPGNRLLGGFRFRLKSDALDDQEYPTLGWLNNFQLDKISRHLGSDFSYSKWQPDLHYFIPVSDKTTVAIHGVGAFTHGEVPFYQRVFVGGYNFSEGGPRQLLGFSRDEFAARQAVLAGTSYRRQIFSHPLTFARRGFLFLQYNIAGISDSAAVPYKFRFYNGAGGGLLLDTIVGPMRFVGAWGEGGRGRFYISLGPAF